MTPLEQACRWARMRERNAASEADKEEWACLASWLEERRDGQYIVPWLISRAPYVALGAVVAVMVMR